MEIKEAYVSREVAKLLKEKGFDIPCHYTYHSLIGYIPLIDYHHKKHNYNGSEYRGKNTEWFSAPTHQMACAWLREVHKLAIIISPQWAEGDMRNPCRWYWEIWSLKDNTVDVYSQPLCSTYEEAAEAGLKYALTNLI